MSLLETNIPPEGQPLPGAERYTLRRLLGRGGFGDAYLADDEALARRVVIKLLMNLTEPSIRDRFLREARISANIHHPSVVAVHDIGALPDGRPYFVMEFIDGMPLSQFIKERASTLAQSHALTIIAQAAEGLSAAHAIGVIHRDIKPDNILITRAGMNAKLIDFGIAKKAMEESGGTGPHRVVKNQATQAGTVLGTPRYISPEQATAKVLAAASDLYSLGCVMYAVLTGRSPFEGSPQELMMHHVYTPPPTLASAVPGKTFPRDVEGIVARLLNKDPLRRYQTGEELARALRRCVEQAKAEEETDATAALPTITDPTLQDSSGGPMTTPRLSVPLAAPPGWDEAATVSQAHGQHREVAPAAWTQNEGSETAAFVGVSAQAAAPSLTPQRSSSVASHQLPAIVMRDDLTGQTQSTKPSRAGWVAFAVVVMLVVVGGGTTLAISMNRQGSGATPASTETAPANTAATAAKTSSETAAAATSPAPVAEPAAIAPPSSTAPTPSTPPPLTTATKLVGALSPTTKPPTPGTTVAKPAETVAAKPTATPVVVPTVAAPKPTSNATAAPPPPNPGAAIDDRL